MNLSFLDDQFMLTCHAPDFRNQHPFPWGNFQGLLTSHGFASLNRDFPSLEFFERHVDIPRNYGQRPHNRYYLAYERSIYHREQPPSSGGVVSHSELPPTWQGFIDELEQSREYQRFIASVFETEDYKCRYAWHLGVTDSEVSPHCDHHTKIGTHIFYFNTKADWSPEWGGETLVLGGKRTDTMNPDFNDFDEVHSSPILDNRSFLFRNTAKAWHGVKPLRCPPGKHRRLFNVIFEFPDSGTRPFGKRWSSLLRRSASALSRGTMRLRDIVRNGLR